jgi:hypothetical protein
MMSAALIDSLFPKRLLCSMWCWLRAFYPQQNFFQNESKSPARCWCLMSIILATWEAEIRRIVVPGQPRQILWETLITKITRAKWTEDVTRVVEVEPLLCKHKALSSNASPTKINK